METFYNDFFSCSTDEEMEEILKKDQWAAELSSSFIEVRD
jgi:hypothetical protein